jgi:tRNA threonylcarbamoyladenosine biosynthesis protein TsaE
MAVEVRLTTHSEEETEALAEALGLRLSAPALIALDGDLGAGKTCFVRGLARGLGVKEPISSPTYSLMAQYRGRVPFLHMDAWMEGRERAFLMDGGSELLVDAVCAVEWAAKVSDVLPAARIEVRLRAVPGAPEERLIELRSVGGDAGLDHALQELDQGG